jgi:hypothetical protein|tara:strand:- start:3814 stop:4029 length:216 start_codon:yes stop_codon:yes gene_type:complete
MNVFRPFGLILKPSPLLPVDQTILRLSDGFRYFMVLSVKEISSLFWLAIWLAIEGLFNETTWFNMGCFLLL